MHVSQNISGLRKNEQKNRFLYTITGYTLHIKISSYTKYQNPEQFLKRDLELNIGSEGQHFYYDNSDRRSSVVGAAAASPFTDRDEVLY